MKLTTALLMMVFLSGCLGLDTVRNPAAKPRNTHLDKPPKVYLTMKQINQMNRQEIREYLEQ